MEKTILLLNMILALWAGARALEIEPHTKVRYWVMANSFFLAIASVLEYRIAKLGPNDLEQVLYLAPYHTVLNIMVILIGVWGAFFFANLSIAIPGFSRLSWVFLFIQTGLAFWLIFVLLQGWLIWDIDHLYRQGNWYCSQETKGLHAMLLHGWLVGSIILLSLFFFSIYRQETTPGLRAWKFFLFFMFTVLPVIYLLVFIYGLGSQRSHYFYSPLFNGLQIITVAVYSNYRLFDLSPVNVVDKLLDSLESLVILVDDRLSIKYSNQAFKKEMAKLGRRPDEKISLPELIASIDEQYRPDLKLLVKMKKMQAGQQFDKEIALVIQAEKKYWISNFSPVFNKKGSKTGYVIVAKEITQLKEDEWRMRNYTSRLAKSNADLERFAYIASHDLKTPVRNINSFAALLDRRIQDLHQEDWREYTQFILGNADYMHQLIQNILEYSKVGSSPIAFEKISLESVLVQVKEALAPGILEKKALLLHGPLPMLHSNHSLMGSLLYHLLENALKFNTAEQPEIVVTAERYRHSWVIRVRDNGIGIEPEYQEQ